MPADLSPRLSLPLLVAGQAQKETTHNESLLLLDWLAVPLVEDFDQASPPAAPALGQCWSLGSAPGGAWAGHGNALALWTAGGWRFITPPVGMIAIRRADGGQWHLKSDGWHAPQALADPAGGSVIDAECRLALAALCALLRARGLVAS